MSSIRRLIRSAPVARTAFARVVTRKNSRSGRSVTANSRNGPEPGWPPDATAEQWALALCELSRSAARYAAAAALSGGGSDGAQSTAGQRPLPPAVTGGDGSLTPQQLDRLRQREIASQAQGPEHGGR